MEKSKAEEKKLDAKSNSDTLNEIAASGGNIQNKHFSRVLEERTFGKLNVLEIQLKGQRKKRSMKTLVYLPGNFSPDLPVVMVMHGVARDPWAYMESWIGLAERYGFILTIPEFSRADWPTTYAYNLGNVRTRGGKNRAVELWSFTALDNVFDAICERFALSANCFYLYGHSAGAQFVHRYMLHTGAPRVKRAVAANAGWYLLPSKSAVFPYGTSDLSIDQEAIEAALKTPLTILLGKNDNEPNSRDLRVTEEAMAQGPHRLARGLNFIEAAKLTAFDLDCAFRWHAEIVPEAGHNDRSIAPHACASFFGPPPRL